MNLAVEKTRTIPDIRTAGLCCPVRVSPAAELAEESFGGGSKPPPYEKKMIINEKPPEKMGG